MNGLVIFLVIIFAILCGIVYIMPYVFGFVVILITAILINLGIKKIKNYKYIDDFQIIKYTGKTKEKNYYECVEEKKIFYDYYEQKTGTINFAINNKLYYMENIYRIAFVEEKDDGYKNINIKKNLYCNSRRKKRI